MQEGIVKVHTAAETGLPSGATVTVLTFPSALLSPLPAPSLPPLFLVFSSLPMNITRVMVRLLIESGKSHKPRAKTVPSGRYRLNFALEFIS